MTTVIEKLRKLEQEATRKRRSVTKMLFRRMDWIIGHIQHLGAAEIRWLIARLQEKELPDALEREVQ